MASASIDPVRAVESFRSVNTRVTNLRTSEGGRIGAVVAGRDGDGARRLPNGLASPPAVAASETPSWRCASIAGGPSTTGEGAVVVRPPGPPPDPAAVPAG